MRELWKNLNAKRNFLALCSGLLYLSIHYGWHPTITALIIFLVVGVGLGFLAELVFPLHR